MSVSNVPFADPLWLNRHQSPYYKESHHRLQKEVREYVDECIAPFCEEWEKQGFVPPEVSRYSLSIYSRTCLSQSHNRFKSVTQS
jgi:hypothetical protein